MLATAIACLQGCIAVDPANYVGRWEGESMVVVGMSPTPGPLPRNTVRYAIRLELSLQGDDTLLVADGHCAIPLEIGVVDARFAGEFFVCSVPDQLGVWVVVRSAHVTLTGGRLLRGQIELDYLGSTLQPFRHTFEARRVDYRIGFHPCGITELCERCSGLHCPSL